MLRAIQKQTKNLNIRNFGKHCIQCFVTTSDSNVFSSSLNLGSVNDNGSLQNGTPESVFHVPVMITEVLEYLKLCPGKKFVDMTFGSGGHSKKILQLIPDAIIFALDRDPIAYEGAQKLAEEYPGQVIPLLGRFSELPHLLAEQNISHSSVDGFLFDFGCSSMQFDVGERGFSISKDGPLDMRMDGCRCPEQPTAADVLQQIDEKNLASVLRVYGQEKRAKRVARSIIETRYSFRKLQRTSELAQVVASALSNEIRTDSLGRPAHCATKTFQALRIFVNNELNEINYGMLLARYFLKQSGLVVTISFHSLEDTIVKRHLQGYIADDTEQVMPLKYTSYDKCFSKSEMELIKITPWKMLHKHVVTPTDAEISSNPRSRSAKLRALMKI